MRSALAAGLLGLAMACAGNSEDDLGGSVRIEWRAPRQMPAMPARPSPPHDSAVGPPHDTTRATRDTASSAKHDTATVAKHDSAPVSRVTARGRRDATIAKRELGSMQGRGAVVWCPGPKLAIVTGVQGDTGVGLIVHPRDSLVPGTYPVLAPDSARATAPAAAVALRLMSRASVDGYQGIGGALRVTAMGRGRLSATIRADAQALGAMKRLELEGELRDLPVRVGGPACPP